jgi:glycosyltransferase involved in cell wall biosynthesis
MNILFLRHIFIIGGVHGNFKLLFGRLIDKGHNIYLGTTITPEVEDFRKLGVKLIELPVFPSNIFNLVKSIFLIVREVKINNIEVIHSSHRFTSVIGKIAGLISGVPVNVSVHEYFHNRRIVSRVWSKGNIITPSEGLRDHLIKKYGSSPEAINVINNPIDDRYVLAETKLNIVKKMINYDPECKYIGCIGRLSVEKGVQYFIESISLLKNRHNIVFVIAGDGPEMAFLRKMAEKIDADIMFLGIVKGNYELISLMDLIVIPSLSEGFGIIAAEAMLLSKPVIASKVGGLPEIVIHNETGYLVNSKSGFEIAECIKNLLENPDKIKIMGQRGRQISLNKYGLERYADCYMHQFRSLISKNKKLIST